MKLSFVVTGFIGHDLNINELLNVICYSCYMYVYVCIYVYVCMYVCM